ncbi:MAG TPA: DNA polymerase III subunit chi [Nevskiaceae bacterium]
MTRIDFYLLTDTGTRAAIDVTCRLCDKAAARGKRVYVHSVEADTVDELDAALWSFRQGSFIAHERYTGEVDAAAPPAVLLGHLPPPDEYRSVMINLAAETPAFFSQFERVLEVVSGDARVRAAARKRFRFYRDRGYALEIHELGANGAPDAQR